MEKYTLNVPISLSAVTEETLPVYTKMLRRVRASRVFIALLDRKWLFQPSAADKEKLQKIICAFETAGFATGVWVSGFGFGGAVADSYWEMAKSFTRITSITGKKAEDAFCPTDKSFTALYQKLLFTLMDCGARMIMLDDDLCLSVRPGIGCACDTHLTMLGEKLGKKITREDVQKSFTGKPNRMRTAFIKVMGETMHRFCAEMRAAIDRVDPSVRLGFCAGYTAWDLEGENPMILSRLLAGNTKPFFRLMGAPYWVTRNRFTGQRLATVIEAVRMQYAWCRCADIEMFSENDSWPRPRYHTPAAYCEIFDLALRAAGETETLKYMFDYYAPPQTETGYVDAHVRHDAARVQIKRAFDGKKAIGVRVFEYPDKINNAELPADYIGDYEIMQRTFSPAACMLSSHAIPTVYEGRESVGIVFGENAEKIDTSNMGTGLIMDVPAAQILQKRGIDTGLSAFWENGFVPSLEVFSDFRETANLSYANGIYYDVKMHKNAKVLSWFQKENQKIPAVYIYENAAHLRCMVFCMDAYRICQSSDVFLSYARGRQIKRALHWLGGSALFPLTVAEHPGLYMLCGEGEDGQTAALFNICEDPIYEIKLRTRKRYKKVEAAFCCVKQEGDMLRVKSEIPPFGVAVITMHDA